MQYYPNINIMNHIYSYCNGILKRKFGSQTSFHRQHRIVYIYTVCSSIYKYRRCWDTEERIEDIEMRYWGLNKLLFWCLLYTLYLVMYMGCRLEHVYIKNDEGKSELKCAELHIFDLVCLLIIAYIFTNTIPSNQNATVFVVCICRVAIGSQNNKMPFSNALALVFSSLSLIWPKSILFL